MTSSTTTSPQIAVSAPARRKRSAWRNKYVGPIVTAIAVLACGAALVLTIQLTLFDLQWPAFLIGVLFAAVVSLICQSIKAQSMIVRRTAQLRRAQESLVEHRSRYERCTAALKVAEQRFRAFLDAIPMMAFYVDREERCRDHNRAFGEWCGRNPSGITGVPVQEVLGDTLYREIHERGSEALLGQELEYESQWERSGSTKDVVVKVVPQPPGAQTPNGFFVLVSAAAKAPEPPVAEIAGPTVIEAQAVPPSAQVIDLRARERQLSPQEDAREFLLRAIEEDRFVLLEQKIAALETKVDSIDMREVLLRLRDAEDQTVAPGGFFDVAEHHGVLALIDRWVIRNLLKASAARRADNRSWRMPVYGVNLSNATIGDVTFPAYLRAQLAHWQLSGNRLCFEIGHTTVTERAKDVYALMNAVKSLGCWFSLDSFGSQKVSFSGIEHLEFNFVKIDGHLIEALSAGEAELRKVAAIVTVCRKLGIRSVAQFVQDDETRAKLAGISIDYVQGFGVSKPVPLGSTTPA